ncbi:MAG: hypothetical protein KJZ78_25185 [Bryobacteraceae bacterium]|nr:hypothetical protein [Bryobacteraceae bacterium]
MPLYPLNVARFSIGNALLSSGLFTSLLIQSSCTRHIPEGTQQGGESSESGNQVAREIDDRPHKQAVDKPRPVTASFRAEPAKIRAGGLFRLVIDVHIVAGWHIYALNKPAGVAVPSKIRLCSPTFVEEIEAWASDSPPNAELQGQEVVHVYDGNVTFRCPTRVSKHALKGTTRVRCVLEYQACDRFSCQPLEELILETEVIVLP